MQHKIIELFVLTITMVIVLGCKKHGKLHVDVIIPAEVSNSGKQWTRAAVDAHDRPSGDMMYRLKLPDGKTVYCTRAGYLGTKSLLDQNAARIKKGWVPWIFKVEEDTIWDYIKWGYIRWAGSRAGHPEGALGNPVH